MNMEVVSLNLAILIAERRINRACAVQNLCHCTFKIHLATANNVVVTIVDGNFSSCN